MNQEQSKEKCRRNRDNWKKEALRLRREIELTIEENLHLADGDDCTLIRLKRALGYKADVAQLPIVPDHDVVKKFQDIGISMIQHRVAKELHSLSNVSTNIIRARQNFAIIGGFDEEQTKLMDEN